jgi:hypothetical protein
LPSISLAPFREIIVVYYGEKLSGKAAFCQLKRLDRKYGSLSFVERVKSELGFKAAHREVIEGAAHEGRRGRC